MSLINQMLRDLQSHGSDPALSGRPLSGMAKCKAAIIRQFAAGCIGLVFLGIVWLACDLLVGARPADQHSAGTGRDSQQGQPAPAANNLASQDSGNKARGGDSPGDNGAGAVVPPAVSAGARHASSAKKDAVAYSFAADSRVVAPVASLPNPGSLRQNPPDALTEEEITLIPNASAEQAYQAGKRALLHGSNNELAVKYLRQALALNPGHLPARELLAEVYHKVSRNDAAAMDLLREGLHLAPGHTVIAKKYSRMLADRGDHAAAVKVLLHGGLPAIKGDAEALEFLAVLYLRLEEPYLAAQTYRNLVATWPRNGNYWFGLGSVLENQGQAGDAVNCYRKALDTNNLRRDSKEQAMRRLAALTQIPPG